MALGQSRCLSAGRQGMGFGEAAVVPGMIAETAMFSAGLGQKRRVSSPSEGKQ